MPWFTLEKPHLSEYLKKKINPLDIFLTYRNSQLCFEVVNIPLRKDIAYKRTKLFTLNLRNLLACKSWKQFMARYITRQTVLSHDVMGDMKLRGAWRSCEHLLRSTDFFALENFFSALCGKEEDNTRKTRTPIVWMYSFYYIKTHFAGQISTEGASGSKNAV